MRGCVEYARSRGIPMRTIVADAVGSILFGGRAGKRLIPGHGASIRPGLHAPDLVDRIVPVTDFDCVIGCRRLVRLEGILAGGSSGGIVAAFERILGSIEDHAVCVAILADRGERYLDTIYSDQWVTDNFGGERDLAERIAS
jgi:cysteine synthase A